MPEIKKHVPSHRRCGILIKVFFMNLLKKRKKRIPHVENHGGNCSLYMFFFYSWSKKGKSDRYNWATSSRPHHQRVQILNKSRYNEGLIMPI